MFSGTVFDALSNGINFLNPRLIYKTVKQDLSLIPPWLWLFEECLAGFLFRTVQIAITAEKPDWKNE